MARNTYFQDEVIEQKFNAKQLFRILRYAVPYKKTFALAGALMCVAVGLSLLPALFIKKIVDEIIPQGDYNSLYMIIGAFFMIGLFDISLQFFNGRKMARTGHTIIYNIRNDIYYKLQQLSFDYFDNRPTGKIVIRVTAYIDELANFFANTLLNFIINIIKMAVVLIFLFILNYVLALVVVAAILPMGVFIFIIRSILKKQYQKAKNKDSNRAAFVHENILGVTVTKSFNRDSKNQDIYKDLYQQSMLQWRKLVAVNELFVPGVEGLWNIGNLMIYIVAMLLIGGGQHIQAGTVIAFITYLGMFTLPLNQLAFIFQQFSAVSANLERIFDTMDTEPLVKDRENAAELPPIEGDVEFENVSFSYDNNIYVLENFNLKVPKGKTIALVGPTGAGKSTVVNLIPRFYDVSGGRVLIDGFDVRDVTLNSLRSQMGIMMQDTFIFKGSIIDNIRYAREDATDEQCVEAAKEIFADEFINKLPNGYYTEVPERGEGLSAGEKQLLSFARVMLCNPKILILDEATSSIDTNTEQSIQKALKVLLAGRTSFIIAHRLSTIKSADCILYIADKGIAEAGTHKQLMAKKGLYYNLYKNN
jgi:ABC-type multidrug transport system fused ATPase/permease subunit